MAHLPALIVDLALIMGAAAIIILLFKWLKQPLVLGYIIAGFLVGPYFKWLPTISDIENIRTWAEIGVIFLLFSLGLEFSFKKLVKVGGSASITALVEVIFMVAIGFGVGKLMGWSAMDSLFLGGILSISSTTIIIRAFDELGLKTKKFATLVFGVLIVEDLVAIVLMVMLSTVAVSRQFAGAEMMFSILKLVFFLVIWFLMGIFFIPTFLRKVKHLVSDEMLLIIAIALCLLMVVFANAVGFSPALGAFIMGSILAETTKAEKIEHLVMPVRDMFGAIFFVSVGMLIDPNVLIKYALPIGLLCVITIIGKILSTTTGALLSGQPLQNSIQAGFSVAQIGEFSFIIATLGLTLNVTSDFLYPIAVAVSAVTTLTTPYLIKSSGSFYLWMNGILPKKIITRLNKYSTESERISQVSEWKLYLRSTVVNVILLSIIIVSIIVIASVYVQPFTNGSGTLAMKVTVVLLTLLILSPFLWALAIRTPSELHHRLIANPQYRGRLYISRLIKLAIASFFIGLLLQRFFNVYAGVFFTAIILSLLLIFAKKIQLFYSRLENRFINNLNQREIETSKTNRTELAPWDAHIVPITVSSFSPGIGKTLFELKWREKVGVNIVMIKRGDFQIPAPGRDAMIFPHDELLVLGTDHQIQRLRVLLRAEQDKMETELMDVELFNYLVHENSSLIGKSIRQTGLRDIGKALVVGVGRDKERLLNPDSEFILKAKDVLHVVGNRAKLKSVIAAFEDNSQDIKKQTP